MAFPNLTIYDVQGVDNLISLTSSTLLISSGNIQLMRTYSSFIFEFSDSTSILSNLEFSQFYPRLIYSVFSIMDIYNCSFSSSFVRYGIFEVNAIYFEYNNSFQISNCQFNSLSNDMYGAVNFLNLFHFKIT